MEPFATLAYQLAWGDLSWLTAAVLAAAGVVFLGKASGSVASGSESIRLVVRMRRLMWGAVLLTLAAGLLTHQPVLIAIALVIGFEETLEMGIALWALRQDPAA
jgi:hypothetical protein